MPASSTPLPPLPPAPAASPEQAALGKAIHPLDRLKLASPAEWEEMVLEWAHMLKNRYVHVERCAGAGDRGRDVIAYLSGPGSEWDNYQCKHYDHRLHPGDIWVELGKLCYYTFKGDYSVPRTYYFVAPQGAGNKLSLLLKRPAKLRAELITRWDKHCKTAITATQEIPLTPELRAHIEAIDFAIFQSVPPLKLLDEYRLSPFFVFRFGGGLPVRPPVPPPPAAPAPVESTYVRALLDAYEDRTKESYTSSGDLADPVLVRHFSRSRKEFYSAEALREFSRDNVPVGTFEHLQEEVYGGVADVHDAMHPDGLERVLQTVKQAKAIHLTGNILVPRVTPSDCGGICHQLANELRLTWRR